MDCGIPSVREGGLQSFRKGNSLVVVDEYQVALKELRALPLGALTDVSKRTKIPWPTLVKIKYRTTEYPRLPTLKKLAAYFGNGHAA